MTPVEPLRRPEPIAAQPEPKEQPSGESNATVPSIATASAEPELSAATSHGVLGPLLAVLVAGVFAGGFCLLLMKKSSRKVNYHSSPLFAGSNAGASALSVSPAAGQQKKKVAGKAATGEGSTGSMRKKVSAAGHIPKPANPRKPRDSDT